MGTRSSYGFRSEGKDYLMYSQFDGYPTGLGLNLMEQLKYLTVCNMKTGVARLVAVDEDSEPKDVLDNEEYQELFEMFHQEVSKGTDWYSFLRGSQQNISIYFTEEKPLKYFIEANNFIHDSLFCEYAYIVNLDTEMLEFYRGYNTSINSGRYTEMASGGEYKSCFFVGEIPLAALQTSTSEKNLEFCQKLQQYMDSIKNIECLEGFNKSLDFQYKIENMT